MVVISEIKKKIILFCHAYFMQNKYAPSYAEIVRSLGVQQQTVVRNLKWLHEAGYITCYGSRQIRVDMLPR